MPRLGSAYALGGVGLVVIALAAPPLRPARAAAQPQASAAGVNVAKLAWGDRPVERASGEGTSWRRLSVGDPIRTGDRLRTASAGVARLDLPWMTVTLGPSSELMIPAKAVLSTVLERGRAEFKGEGRDIVKIEVSSGEIRGGGHLVLRREGNRTAATALDGAFRVSAEGRTVQIRAGQGTTVTDGQPPTPAAPLPEAPKGLVPGLDPQYVPSGRGVELHWSAGHRTHHVQVLALQSDDVLLARDVGEPPARLEIPWLGTYRWRVSARDGRGVESPPSPAGYLCVVEK